MSNTIDLIVFLWGLSELIPQSTWNPFWHISKHCVSFIIFSFFSLIIITTSPQSKGPYGKWPLHFQSKILTSVLLMRHLGNHSWPNFTSFSARPTTAPAPTPAYHTALGTQLVPSQCFLNWTNQIPGPSHPMNLLSVSVALSLSPGKGDIKAYVVPLSLEALKNTKQSQWGNESLGNKMVIMNRAMGANPKCPLSTWRSHKAHLLTRKTYLGTEIEVPGVSLQHHRDPLSTYHRLITQQIMPGKWGCGRCK